MYPEETKIEKDTCIPPFAAALFTRAGTWKQPRCPSTDEGIKKLWCIYNATLLSNKKEYIWGSSNEVDEHRTYYIELSKSERERQISSINTHIWNLERWYWRSSVQGSKGDTDIKNRLLDSVGEGEGGMIWENSTETCILPYVKQLASLGLMHEMVLRAGALGWPWGMGGGMGVQDGGHMYTHGWFMSMYDKNHYNVVK